MEIPRVVPSEGMILCDRFVPGGTSVGVSPYIVHRQRAAYGDDADTFRPERWIEAELAEKEQNDGGQARRRLEKYYFVFGGSTTSCIVRFLPHRAHLDLPADCRTTSFSTGEEHLVDGD
jgi:hypothetical protein